MTLTHEQKEEVRHATLEALALRHPAALAPRQISKAVNKELPFLFEETDLAAALELLAGLTPPLAESLVDDLGATKRWRATSAGVLDYERR